MHAMDLNDRFGRRQNPWANFPTTYVNTRGCRQTGRGRAAPGASPDKSRPVNDFPVKTNDRFPWPNPSAGPQRVPEGIATVAGQQSYMAFEARHLSIAGLADPQSERRAALFRETPAETLKRVMMGTAWALQPKRIAGLPALGRVWLNDLLAPSSELPDPTCPLNAGGLCGMVRTPSPASVVQGYKQGLFTFAHYGPLKWVSLPERCVLFFDEFHIATNVRRFMRQGRYTVTFDRDFNGVITACAAPRQGRWHVTWITPRIMRLYAELFDAGHVHSIEVWNQAGELVGGSFGLAAGRVFFGESQFTREAHTSKIAMAALTWHLAKWGFAFSDGKWETPTMRDMGFRCIPRAEFLAHLASAVNEPGRMGRWEAETDLPTVAAWKPARPATPGMSGEARKPAHRRESTLT
ncbi:MAG: leucyl/phenylalanyl-tRNA--protein transferase [Rhizobiales bacterium]|nr:leucyl/phenylalanyl-tRNA--protein transferase [Hyphomicrobiales bacterium]